MLCGQIDFSSSIMEMAMSRIYIEVHCYRRIIDRSHIDMLSRYSRQHNAIFE